MSDLIRRLEQAGRDAALSQVTREKLLREMSGLDKKMNCPNTIVTLPKMNCPNTIAVLPKMHCVNQLVRPPKLYCQNQIVTPPKKKAPANNRSERLGLYSRVGVPETMYCINQIVMPPKASKKKKRSAN